MGVCARNPGRKQPDRKGQTQAASALTDRHAFSSLY
jgi:hypothetical protein